MLKIWDTCICSYNLIYKIIECFVSKVVIFQPFFLDNIRIMIILIICIIIFLLIIYIKYKKSKKDIIKCEK